MNANALINASVFENANNLASGIDIKQRLQLAIAKARFHKHALALLVLDIDRFSTITSTLGLESGKQLIDQVRIKLLHALNGDYIFVHIGSDQFAILCESVTSSSQQRQLANRLLSAIKKPFYLDEQEILITASIGISNYPNKAKNDQELLHQALIALAGAKQIGGDNIKFYSRGSSNAAQMRTLTLEVELRHAISRKDLLVHYQPKMDLSTGKVTALEALVRWQHDELGWIPPSEFIPIAEKAGLISQIGEMVLETACRHGTKWCEEGIEIKIAVNLSAKQLIRSDMASVIKRILKRTGFRPELLVVELTESLLIDTLEKTHDTLNALREMGIEIAIDDFGTGYSTFKLLKRLPVDILKIDQMFILDVANNKVDAAITQAIINVAHALEMKVIAEGVEKKEHVGLLQDLGCDVIQGFYLSKPLPRNEITPILKVGIPRVAQDCNQQGELELN